MKWTNYIIKIYDLRFLDFRNLAGEVTITLKTLFLSSFILGNIFVLPVNSTTAEYSETFPFGSVTIILPLLNASRY